MSNPDNNSHDLFFENLHKYRLLLPVLAPFLFALLLELVLLFGEVKLFSEKKDNQTLMGIQQCRSGDGDVDYFCQFSPKNPNGNLKRIFIFGDSTAAGYPEYITNNFGGNLQNDLNMSQSYSVENYAAPCRYSNYARRCIERALEAKPDMIIVYTGHNDFTNQFHPQVFAYPGLFKIVTFLRNHSRIYAVMSDLLSNKDEKNGTYSISDENQYQSRMKFVISNFIKNIDEIYEQAKSNQIKLVIITPVSNLSEFEPPQRNLRSNYFSTKRELSINLLKTGGENFNKGKFNDALLSYQNARDNDPVPSRFTSEAYQQLISFSKTKIFFWLILKKS